MLGAPLDQARAGVRAGRIFLADGARPDLRGGAGQGLGAEGDRDDRVRRCCCRWSGPTSRPARRAWRSTFPNSPTVSALPRWRWACSALREIIRNLDAGAEMDRDLVQQKITGLMPTKKDLIDSCAGHRPRHDPGIDPRHPAGRRRGDRLVRGLYARRRRSPRIRRGSAAARSKAWRRRKAPTTRRRRPRSSRC